jgi:cellulose synthase/poly-beta-1,6-N-acetylglucosamine synthase-like glycosyltransferase
MAIHEELDRTGCGYRPRVVALIAAHDEEEQLPRTLVSLAAQTRPVDRIVVMADNCSDATVEVARAAGAEVFETVANCARKAGALNQGLERVGRESFDYLVQVDADTELEPEFVEAALAELQSDPGLGGVCARFFPKYRPGLLGALQRLEYARYDRSRMRRGGHVSVLSGTGSVLRAAALTDLTWSETSLVEDYVLTLDLRRRGWRVRAGERMIAHTDSMISLSALWRQRIRWTRGTIEELVREGWKPWTRADILAHAGIFAALAVRLLWAAALSLAALEGRLFWSPLWLAPLALAVVEGVISTRRLRWQDRLLLLLVLPEELYGLLRQAWTCKAAALAFAGGQARW